MSRWTGPLVITAILGAGGVPGNGVLPRITRIARMDADLDESGPAGGCLEEGRRLRTVIRDVAAMATRSCVTFKIRVHPRNPWPTNPAAYPHNRWPDSALHPAAPRRDARRRRRSARPAGGGPRRGLRRR